MVSELFAGSAEGEGILGKDMTTIATVSRNSSV